VSSPRPRGREPLVQNFDGVSSLDSANTNFGAEFEPPDPAVCVGNGFVVEMVNSAYRIYRPDGKTIAGPTNINVIFHEGLTEFTSDPRCYFDASTNTWFAVILFINATNTASTVDVAVNASGDPTTPWSVFRLDTTDDGSNGTPNDPGCPCFGDQPLLGIDRINFYVSTNEFSILGPEFNGAQIYALDKSDLVAGRPPHFVHFGNLSIGGAPAASVQPAITNGGAQAEFFMNSLDPLGNGDDRLGVWAMTDRRKVGRGRVPTLSSIVIHSEAYSVPPPAVQMGSPTALDSGDDRMQQVQFIRGNLWGALGTAVTIRHDQGQRAGAAWFVVHPKLIGGKIGGAKIQRQGYLASASKYLLYPAIQADGQGNAVITVALSGATQFPSAAFSLLSEDHKAFGPVVVAAPGTGPYDPRATRWGDYSWATLDPGGDAFWLATEYVPPVSSQTPDRRRNWGTRVMEVRVGD
jgi:hypothetical protein